MARVSILASYEILSTRIKLAFRLVHSKFYIDFYQFRRVTSARFAIAFLKC